MAFMKRNHRCKSNYSPNSQLSQILFLSLLLLSGPGAANAKNSGSE
jgi:hypothetical protein